MRRVYVLGAGASKGAGLPLMNDFLDRAKELKDKLRDKFDDLWDYFNEPKFRNLNIEDILGYLDMEISLNNLNFDKRIKYRLLNFIQNVIILSYYYGDDKNLSHYSNLLNRFIQSLTKDDTIITFNYDVLIDDFLNKNGFLPDYGIDLQYKKLSEKETHIPLFKLHGSLNWSICGKCQKPSWNEYDNLLKRSKSTKNDDESDELYQLFELTNRRICQTNEKHRRIEETLIVPPSWNKHDYPYIKDLWLKASNNLKNANKIIFIGYSFPQTDIYFKYLLLTSLPKSNIPVEVVDPKIQNIAGRYLEIFRDNISFKSMTFEEYISDII